ncbi:MAG: ribbon-helix-helix domain-containing protein [Acetobacteraceae bacterium]
MPPKPARSACMAIGTSIRLETAFWDTLEEIAASEGITVARFCVILHDEMMERHGEIGNFASLLRVTCLHYLRHQELHAAELAERRAGNTAVLA